MMSGRVLPTVVDHDTRGYWAAAARRELVVSFCASCGSVVHLPMSVCSRCHGTEIVWRSVDPRASLYSWTTVRHQTHPAFPVPYTIVLVKLDAHPEVNLVGFLAGDPELEAGMAMDVVFEHLGAGVVLPQWVPRGQRINE